MEIVEWLLRDNAIVAGLFSVVTAVLGIFGRQLRSYHSSLRDIRDDLVDCEKGRSELTAEVEQLKKQVERLKSKEEAWGSALHQQSLEMYRLRQFEKKVLQRLGEG